jgi:phenylpyruvate tautomerase PptA (4-oxalocrotonate tautomerase family)
MRTVSAPERGVEATDKPGELSRRAVLATAAMAAGAGVGIAQPVPATSFGSPLVELSFPVGVLSLDQKAALIRAVTDVVNTAMNLAPDPSRRLFVEIFETPEGGFGVNGQAVVPRGR